MINRPGFEHFEAKPTPTQKSEAPHSEQSPLSEDERKLRIRTANDIFRQTLSGGEVFCTSGIVALGTLTQLEVLDKVRAFKNFDKENDPHEERDFGSFKHNGQRIFWKIDYYDQELQGGSPEPANAEVTRRVLTVMLASEY